MTEWGCLAGLADLKAWTGAGPNAYMGDGAVQEIKTKQNEGKKSKCEKR